MRILVTNDDGIHSEGLDACAEIARTLSDDVWTVAPETGSLARRFSTVWSEKTTPQPNVSSGRLRSTTTISWSGFFSFIVIAK